MITILKPENFDKLVDFANREFSRNRKKIDFRQFQPKIYLHLDRYGPHHLVCEQNNKIIGMIGTYPIKFKNLNLLGIGTICVDVKFRNLGIMEEMLTYLHKYASEDYDILYLLGNKRRYERFGYFVGGRKVSFHIKKDFFNDKDYNLYPFLRYDVSVPSVDLRLYDLYNKNINSISRDSTCFGEILRTHGNIIYLADTAADKGYLVYDEIHNCVVEAVLRGISIADAIISLMVVRNCQEVNWETSIYDPDIFEFYRLAERSQITQIVNLRVCNYTKILQKLLSVKTDIIPGHLSIQLNSGHCIAISVEEKVIIDENLCQKESDLILTDREFLVLLFDDFCLYHPGHAKAALIKSWFPFDLPATISNIDSI